MKLFLAICAVVSIIPITAFACGPSPQKVVREVVIKADSAKVWAIVGNFSGMHKWHPAVMDSVVESRPDTQGDESTYRTLILDNGGKVVEKRRETQEDEMKLGIFMEQGDIAVSNYSDAITVKSGQHMGESIATWTGRFNNKANAMEAPAGQDNVAAIAAVERFYDEGLAKLKRVVETH
jgi:hypothetical protein